MCVSYLLSITYMVKQQYYAWLTAEITVRVYQLYTKYTAYINSIHGMPCSLYQVCWLNLLWFHNQIPFTAYQPFDHYLLVNFAP